MDPSAAAPGEAEEEEGGRPPAEDAEPDVFELEGMSELEAAEAAAAAAEAGVDSGFEAQHHSVARGGWGWLCVCVCGGGVELGWKGVGMGGS